MSYPLFHFIPRSLFMDLSLVHMLHSLLERERSALFAYWNRNYGSPGKVGPDWGN